MNIADELAEIETLLAAANARLANLSTDLPSGVSTQTQLKAGELKRVASDIYRMLTPISELPVVETKKYLLRNEALFALGPVAREGPKIFKLEEDARLPIIQAAANGDVIRCTLGFPYVVRRYNQPTRTIYETITKTFDLTPEVYSALPEAEF